MQILLESDFPMSVIHSANSSSCPCVSCQVQSPLKKASLDTNSSSNRRSHTFVFFLGATTLQGVSLTEGTEPRRGRLAADEVGCASQGASHSTPLDSLHSTPLDSLFMVEVSRIESFIDVGNAVVIWLPPRLMYGLIYGLRGSYVTHHVRCNCHMAKTITLLIDALVCNTDTRPRPRRASLLCWMRRFSPSRCLKLC